MSEDAFQYQTWDGQTLFKDGFRVWRELVRRLQGRVNDHIEKYNSDNPVMKADGAEALIAATRGAFSLPDFNGMNGEGASDNYALRLFGLFNAWQEKKNQTAESPATSSVVSDSSPTSMYEQAGR